MKALADGLASYSLIQLVLKLLRVGVWVKSVLPLTLREAQGVLFAVQVKVTPGVCMLMYTEGSRAGARLFNSSTSGGVLKLKLSTEASLMKVVTVLRFT